ncbi:Vacuolar membrane protease [Fusarium oligoseptatum]|uniref:Vacuolar membrane protease n=1 Tax=Fusarium oligoseptatum TaxID=2604345 RepID=A0A428U0M7_9HYPO|nr:Vacuolar membrane protease [Fusarium oligoseptatum]
MECLYDSSSLSPHLVEGKTPRELITFETVDGTNASKGRLRIDALDSRLCYLHTSRPIYGFAVDGGAARDPRFGGSPSEGFKTIQLWRRDRDRPWTVNLYLDEHAQQADKSSEGGHSKQLGDGSAVHRRADDPLEVTVRCAWSDANKPGTIPALDELLKYMPTWAAVTKKNVGLVEVRKTYKV